LLDCVARYKFLHVQGDSKNGTPIYFCDNFRKCTLILTIFFTVEPEIYDS